MLSPQAQRRLATRAPLALDAARPYAVKRNVHEIVVDAPPDRFAAALRETLADPGQQFGMVAIRRAPARVGRPFVAGERFLGTFHLGLGASPLVRWIEESFLSDYAEVVALDERRAVYRYLEGTPIAGSSTYLVDADPAGTRLTVVFEHQEINALAVSVLHRFALRQHDRAALAQARAAARRCGARVVSATTR
jgi:hypothetical protein